MNNTNARAFSSLAELWEACKSYFNWVEDNPVVSDDAISTPRPMTMEGFLFYLNITPLDWEYYISTEEFSDIAEKVNMIIEEQQFVMLAAGLITEESIKEEIKGINKHRSGKALESMTDEELDKKIAELQDQLGGDHD